MTSVTMNHEKNGIEIRFGGKPDASILENLKSNGFRWSGKQKIWYAKQTDERIAFAGNLGDIVETSEAKTKPEIYDLWSMTRTDSIENNFEKYRLYDTKEIAARIRQHLRSRFPICKWSVTKDHNRIDVSLLVSPYQKNSEEVKAIVHYAYKFTQSYNYNDSDSMTDYFDVNFYGTSSEYSIIDYRYQQREMTEEEKAISEKFKTAKAAFDKSEEERKAKELEDALKQREIERKEAEIRAAKEKEIHGKIESSFTEKVVDYFVMQALSPVANKNCSVDEILEDDDYERANCKVSKEIYFDEETYKLFADRLLDDYSFLEGMGGTATDDLRIKSMQDYSKMSEEERKTVEWYNVNCVAVYCDDELKLVIDPQGCRYARYTYLVDDESSIAEEYRGKSGISDEEYQRNLEAAETIEDVSASVIINNNIEETWDNTDFNLYRAAVKEWIFSHTDFEFNVGVVRAITEEKLKTAMYRILTEPEEITEQFKKADLKQGQKVTVILISDWGSITSSKIAVDSVEYGKYAQYDKAVKLTFRQENKRGLYYQWFYRDIFVYDGWVDFPDSLLWEEIPSNNSNTFSMRKTRFLSCDRSQMDAIMDYFDSVGIRPLVNTYKPQF